MATRGLPALGEVQPINTFMAGPGTGVPDFPGFRVLVTADLPGTVVQTNVANIFTFPQTINLVNLITTATDALILENTTLATAGVANQNAPALTLIGHAWNLVPGTDNFIQFQIFQQSIGNTTTPAGTVHFRASTSATSTPAYADMMALSPINGASFASNIEGFAALHIHGNILGEQKITAGLHSNFTGSFELVGITSGSIIINTQAAGGTYTLTYPAASPTTGQVLSFGTPMTWINTSNDNAAQTTVAGSTSGTAVFSQPSIGSSFKKVMIFLNALNGTASFTFPTAFVNLPVVLSTNGLATTKVTSLSTSSVIVTGTADTGFLIIEGF